MLQIKLKMLLAVLWFSYVLSSHTVLTTENPTPKALPLSFYCVDPTSADDEQAPILLIHGLQSSKKEWSGIDRALAQKTGKKVCAADLRNHGDSPWSSEVSAGAMAADIGLLLETLNATKIIPLGHSLGGKVVVHFTLQNPGKVEKLVVEDMRPNGITPQTLSGVQLVLSVFLDALDAPPEGAAADVARTAILEYFKEEIKKVGGPEIDETYLGTWFMCSDDGCRSTTNPQLLRQMLEHPFTVLIQSSGQYVGPALFIYGTLSPIQVLEDKDAILRQFPCAQFVGVEGAGHLVHAFPEFIDAVADFVNA